MALAPTITAPFTATITEAEIPLGPLSLATLIEQKAAAKGINPSLARRVAFCESTFRQFTADGSILRGERNPTDIGLFQINERYHLARSQELGFDIYRTEGNIDYALWLMEKEGIRHWQPSRSCWRS